MSYLSICLMLVDGISMKEPMAVGDFFDESHETFDLGVFNRNN